ncbi:hypothetical protein BDV25DRAFT_158837 [Aspergillus avenaceus]|uniref:Uncharacterized protein n=1 Tax=Aspergillus avenaceus TaxID=36643 RepID=A0A5N6TPX9_ASPAV|nr:hypothetical protein BDV25DRAFT_158837 [Aspergillus avenaceus]
MMFKNVFSLAAIASIATALPTMERRSSNASTAGTGGVNIVNNMDCTVYAWSVSDSVSHMHTLSAGGGSYHESWRLNDNGGGISIKLATEPHQGDILQFEYTQNLEANQIFWDMSAINMAQDNDFTKAGFSVSPSHGDCPGVFCAAGDTQCAEAYLKPDDDHATHGCVLDTDFTVQLGV